MSRDASCSTDPFDESAIEGDLRGRWYIGTTPADRGESHDNASFRNPVVENVMSERVSQREKDMDEQDNILNLEFRDEDILDDAGMFSNSPELKDHIPDTSTPYIVVKDKFGRDRRVRQSSEVAQKITRGQKLPTIDQPPTRTVASYEDI